MSDAKARLQHLLDLADRGPALRAALAEEVAELLHDWPQDYPPAMRGTFEALLERVAQDVDGAARARIAERLANDDLLIAELPAGLLNTLYLSAPPPMRNAILARNRQDEDAVHSDESNEDSRMLLAAARCNVGTFGELFATVLGVAPDVMHEILSDASAQALAIACKGAHVGRAAFSAIAVLERAQAQAGETYARLAAFDAVPQAAAERMLASWRTPQYQRAAE